MKRVLLFGTIVFISLCLASGSYFYRLYQEKKACRVAGVPIQIIAQTGPEKEALKTAYLAELLDLSGDEASKGIREKVAEKKLLKSPVIKEAKVKRIAPGILSIDYSLRKPYVFLADYENLALDREGHPFPFSPFYTPKNMPKLYLGQPPAQWREPIKNRALAYEILDYLEGEIDFFQVESLDVTQATHPSLGRREVVLVLSVETGKHYLRLTPLCYREEFKRYLLLETPEGDKIIDLRLPKLAYIKEKKYG
ncbi:cell division protein FtsQ/DivIB [Simkania sp.]|uniref:cell division protein FtsQ/DivIB n=1 Tax=Simkania sp. TaxID=34094 RepID=UPI003B51F785